MKTFVIKKTGARAFAPSVYRNGQCVLSMGGAQFKSKAQAQRQQKAFDTKYQELFPEFGSWPLPQGGEAVKLAGR